MERRGQGTPNVGKVRGTGLRGRGWRKGPWTVNHLIGTQGELGDGVCHTDWSRDSGSKGLTWVGGTDKESDDTFSRSVTSPRPRSPHHTGVSGDDWKRGTTSDWTGATGVVGSRGSDLAQRGRVGRGHPP